MQTPKLLILIIIVCIALVACNNDTNIINKQNKEDINQILKETKYFKNENSVFELGNCKQLKVADILISMEEQFFKVETKDKQFKIEKPYKPDPVFKDQEKLFMAELSVDKKYLAFQATQLEGEKVFVVNIKTGEYQYVSDKEIVGKPKWAPCNNIFAFTIGQISGEKLAIYNPETRKIDELTEAYVTIFGIKWSERGDFIDFIAEYPSDVFGLYRYILNKNKLIRLNDRTLEELRNWKN